LKASKALDIVVTVAQLGGFIAFALGMYSMITVFSTALPQGGGEMELEMTDPVIIPIHLTPTNQGYLGAQLSVYISLIGDGEVLASNSKQIEVPPGTQVPFDLELSLPLSTAEQYLQEGADVEWVTYIEVSSLFDLISFSNTITMPGGG
jgi:hypothetical protein